MTSPPPSSSFLRAPFALSLLLVVGQQAHAQRRAFRVDARGYVR